MEQKSVFNEAVWLWWFGNRNSRAEFAIKNEGKIQDIDRNEGLSNNMKPWYPKFPLAFILIINIEK